MRLAKVILLSTIVAATCVSMAYASGEDEKVFNKNELLTEYKQNFPFSLIDPISIVPVGATLFKACNAISERCTVVQVPATAALADKIIPGPFVADADASWLAVANNTWNLCAISGKSKLADCVEMRGLSSAEVDVSFARRTIVPVLIFNSRSSSPAYVQAYANAFSAALNQAANLLQTQVVSSKDRSGGISFPNLEDVPIEGGGGVDVPVIEIPPPPPDVPVVEVPGARPSEPGPGGVVEVPIGGIGGEGPAPTPGDGENPPPAGPMRLQNCLAAAANLRDRRLAACNLNSNEEARINCNAKVIFWYDQSEVSCRLVYSYKRR